MRMESLSRQQRWHKQVGRRKIEITDEMCKKAETLAAQGLTMVQIAAVLGMGDRTIFEKRAAYPRFSQSIDDGRAKGIATITNALFNKAKDGDVPAQKYYLNNRDNRNWKDRIANEHTGADGGSIALTQELVIKVLDGTNSD